MVGLQGILIMANNFSTQELLDNNGNIVKEQQVKHAGDGMLMLTAFLGFTIGIILTYLATRGKVLWMTVWGIGLVFISLFLGCATYFEWELLWLKKMFK